jgi:tetratricopeptide (TPR) repeat protein
MIQDRHIRVFISSTFRDLQEERDHLVKSIFPQLRSLCDARAVVWGEVDLRWGITNEEAAEGKVLLLCLEEIERCRPYFIGLLAERYGWVPQHIPDDLVAQQPWLQEHRERSVTELEMLHGVLRDLEMHGHAYFYFRAPDFMPRTPLAATLSPETAHREKLRQLKEQIRHARDAGVCRLRENYHNTVQLGQWVLEDITALVDRLFPEDRKPDLLEREAAGHAAFVRSRASVYVGRQEYLDVLNRHARNDAGSGVLMVRGESGAGKSALLANWALGYQHTQPADLLLTHFVGATSESSDWAAMLRRFLGELRRHFDIAQDIPGERDALRSTFAEWLVVAGAKGRVILIIDGLNQLEDRDGAPDLVWLPPVLPSNVRLVVSTLPGRPLDELTKRACQTLQIQPLTPNERVQLIKDYLAQYTKALERSRIERLVATPQCGNPLYLRAVLEELRVFGDHERLDDRIAHYVSASTVEELYRRILERYEQDYEHDRPDLVRDVMTCLWASRRGLSETELLAMLGPNGQPLPHARWSPLFLAAEQSLVRRSGLIGFANEYLRQAVADRYVPTDNDRRKAHLRLASHFAFGSAGPRQLDELPWQLRAGSHWPPLFDLLSDGDFFHDLWLADEFDAKSYWARLEEHSFRMVDAYRPVLADPGRLPDLTFMISLLFMHAGHPAEALAVLEYLVGHYRRTSNPRALRACLVNQAVILRDRGEGDKAAALLAELEQLSADAGDQNMLRLSLHNQAIILRRRGDLDAAMAQCKRVEQICRALGRQDGLHACLGEQALILQDRGDLDGALALETEVEHLCRELNDKDGLATSLGNQARILHARGALADAVRLYQHVEQLFHELGDKDGLQRTFFNEAMAFIADRRLDEAMGLLKQQESLCRELDNIEDLCRGLYKQAFILKERGDRAGAVARLAEVEDICRR